MTGRTTKPAERHRRDRLVIKRRLKMITKQAKGPELWDRKDLAQPHRMHKKPAFGCKRSQCGICRQKRTKRATTGEQDGN